MGGAGRKDIKIQQFNEQGREGWSVEEIEVFLVTAIKLLHVNINDSCCFVEMAVVHKKTYIKSIHFSNIK